MPLVLGAQQGFYISDVYLPQSRIFLHSCPPCGTMHSREFAVCSRGFTDFGAIHLNWSPATIVEFFRR
jgi:hypothetical protein